MIIKQEDISPVCDIFDKLKLEVAFHGLTEIATSHAVDSDLLKEYCSTTIKLLKDFSNGIENIERKKIKEKNQQLIKDKLYGNDPYGD